MSRLVIREGESLVRVSEVKKSFGVSVCVPYRPQAFSTSSMRAKVIGSSAILNG